MGGLTKNLLTLHEGFTGFCIYILYQPMSQSWQLFVLTLSFLQCLMCPRGLSWVLGNRRKHKNGDNSHDPLVHGMVIYITYP